MDGAKACCERKAVITTRVHFASSIPIRSKMDEAAAREVLLLRAFETVSPRTDAWGDDDRAWASRAASEVVGTDASMDRFLARRAALGVERLAARDRKVVRTLRLLRWREWVGGAVILVALALGFALDSIGPAHRVNILAFPLFALLLWNLAVYLLMMVRATMAIARRGATGGPLSRTIARLSLGVSPSHVPVNTSGALSSFTRDWLTLSAHLMGARVAAILHAAAFAFALGAIASLYLRGVVFDYRAGWESTFLDASQVQGILAFVLGPASSLTGIPVPDEAHLAAIRFPQSQGETAAPWLHLFAATIALFVLLPRGVLGYAQQWRASRLARRFPLHLNDAYFQGLRRSHRGEAAVVHVIPYSYQLSPQATLALNSLMTGVFGATARVTVAPPIAFGEEDALPADLVPSDPLALIAVVVGMTATPEAEHHNVLVNALRQRAGATPVAVLIDDAGFRQRFGNQPSRVEERRASWRRLLEAIGVVPAFVDLASPDDPASEAALHAALDGTP
jgi:hypothetical protein